MKNNIFFSLIILFSHIQTILGQNVWIETDWSNNHFSNQENLETDSSPGELLLLNDPSNMVYSFSPTDLEGVWDMEVYDDKLFIAACSKPVAVNGGEIISYDYSTNSYRWEYNVWEQGVIQLRSHNDKLYIPGVDSQGSWEWGNIYVFDGSYWIRKETVPHGLHVFDLLFFKGEMYVTTGTDLNNNSAIIYKSTDEGDSWNEVFTVTPIGSDFRRFYMMGIYKDTLYVQSDLKAPEGKVLFRYDESDWSEIPFDTLMPSVGILEEFNNNFYFLNGHLLHIYDSINWTTVTLPFSGMVNSSSTWRRIAKGLGFYKNKIYGGGEFGLLYSSENGIEWQLESALGNPSEEIESIETYHGRLYIGINDTTGKGKVYVSAAVSDGTLISLKHNFEFPIESGILYWDAIIPDENTSIKFQIRTAESEFALDTVQFAGPDGTQNTFYSISGQTLNHIHFGDDWMQYKVLLSTANNLLTPILKELSISVLISGVNINDSSSKNQTYDFSIKQNFPNPFNSSTKIEYSIPQTTNVVVKIFDVMGNEIEKLVNEEKAYGSYEIIWNADNLPSGIYFYQLKAGSFLNTKKMLLLK